MAIELSYRLNGRDGWMYVAPMDEIREVWLPICRSRELTALEQCITGGLSITSDIFDQVLEELIAFETEIESRFPYEDSEANIVFRCQRVYKLLSKKEAAIEDLYMGG